MVEVSNNFGKKVFKQKERHVRWGWEKSSDNLEMVRYHFVIQDDRFREKKIEKIISNFQGKSTIVYPFEEKTRFEGKAVGTDYRYLYVSFDTFYNKNFLSFEGVTKNHKFDEDLRERKVGSVEDYVRGIYEKE